jgi:hypothetical protein
LYDSHALLQISLRVHFHLIALISIQICKLMLAHLTLRTYPVLHLAMLPTALALANALLLPKPIVDEQVC